MSIYLIFFFMACNPAWGEPLSLDHLKALAIKQSYQIKSRESSLKAAQLSRDISRSKFLPRFGLSAGNEWVKNDAEQDNEVNFSIYGQINLFNGMRDQKNFEKSGVKIQQAANTLQNSKFNLGLLIEKKYYDFLFLTQRNSINQKHLKRVELHRKYVQKRFTSKLITETDYLEFRLHEKKLRSQARSLKLQLENIEAEIAVLIGREGNGPVRIRGKIPHLTLKHSLPELLKGSSHSPQIKSIKLKREISEITQRFSNAGWLPTVNFRAEHGWLDEEDTGVSADERASRVAITANWEFYSGKKTQRSRQQANHSVSAMRLAQKQFEQKFRIRVQRLYKKLRLLEQTINFEEENEKLSQKFYRKTLREYRKGVRDSGALADASEMLTETQNRVYELKADYIDTKLDLEQTLGYQLKFETFIHNET